MEQFSIRNFCILAHVDHGKSTLADRFLEVTGTIEAREMQPQYLDQLDLERERGITIKMAPVRMVYRSETTGYGLGCREFVLNLIDTPGHSDFSYEVSRALAAVEGAVLLVDATQGIQAQTLVNFLRAKQAGLYILGAVNKIDLFQGRKDEIDARVKEVANLLKTAEENVFKISGKTGEGVKELLNGMIEKVPAPEIHNSRQALIFDSIYNEHKGVVAFARIFGGNFKAGDTTRLVAKKESFKIKEVGYFSPQLVPASILRAGEMGYIATGIKNPDILKIGDTIGEEALLGYEPPRPVVFVSIYPEDADYYDALRYALQKLKLNDSSLNFEPEMNEVLGRGFRCGFLGQLHFEITTERLQKESNLNVISTFPSVAYKVKENGIYSIVQNIEKMSDSVQEILEPMISLKIMTPVDYMGSILQMAALFRMKNIETQSFSNKAIINAIMPLTSLIADFDGRLKSISSGMASFSYELQGESPADLQKVEILVAGEPVPGLTRLMYRDEVEAESRKTLLRLKELLPKEQFSLALQASVQGKIIARETIPAMRKDVTGYLYGGDRTRKMKLWKKQKKGKKRLQSAGRVTIEPHIFKELLKK